MRKKELMEKLDWMLWKINEIEDTQRVISESLRKNRTDIDRISLEVISEVNPIKELCREVLGKVMVIESLYECCAKTEARTLEILDKVEKKEKEGD